MKTQKFRVALAAAAALSIGLCSPPLPAADYVLKYGHPGPAGPLEDDHAAGMFLKGFLESRSNGRIEVQIFPASQLGSFREMVEQVNAGTLELAHSNVDGLAGFLPEVQVVELPYVIRDDMVAECMVDGPFFEQLRAAILERTGNVNLIGVGNTGRWRSFYTTDKQVKSAADIQGLKLRVINSQLPVEMVKALGGNPTPIAWGELYTSLATGVVEGTKNAVTDIVPNKMHEIIKYGVLDEHAYLWGFMVVNQDFLDSLPPDLKQLTVAGIRQMSTMQLHFNKAIEAQTTKEFIEAGGEIYVPNEKEMETFRAVKEPMRDWFVEQFGEEWYDAYAGAAAECETSVDAKLAEWSSR
jgi:TRAP-type transport system periplasmic protein